MMSTNLAAAAITRALGRHGVAATLVRPGVTADAEADTEVEVRVLNRSYEGAANSGVTGLPNTAQRWLIPASELAGTAIARPEPYDRLEFTWGSITIKRVDPGVAYGEIVRWDVEGSG